MAVTQAPRSERTRADLAARRHGAPADEEPTTQTVRGPSLSRGPALVLGTILLAAGLYFLYRSHTYPRWANFPNGHAPVERTALFGIFGINGFTGELTAIAGGLLLFGAAQHLLAKTMSLIVGVALGAAAVIALISGNVLGLAAANHWTELGWGIAAVILLINTLMPRPQRTVVAPVAETGAAGGGYAAGRTERYDGAPAAGRYDERDDRYGERAGGRYGEPGAEPYDERRGAVDAHGNRHRHAEEAGAAVAAGTAAAAVHHHHEREREVGGDTGVRGDRASGRDERVGHDGALARDERVGHDGALARDETVGHDGALGRDGAVSHDGVVGHEGGVAHDGMSGRDETVARTGRDEVAGAPEMAGRDSADGLQEPGALTGQGTPRTAGGGTVRVRRGGLLSRMFGSR